MAVLTVGAAACSGDDSESASNGRNGSATDEAATTEPGPDTGPPVRSAGCSSAPAASAPVLNERRTLDVAGTERWYIYSAPAPEAEQPRPLVMDFHGFAEGAELHSTASKYGELAQEEGFVVVQPHGTGSPPAWNVGADPATNPDLQFVTTLLDTLAAEQCIDLSRVYATGLSMGAFMSSRIACTLSDRFAAVAPVAGIQFPDPCEPSRPVPVLAFHGTADSLLKFNGGIDGAALDDALSGQGQTTTAPPYDLDGEGYPATVRQWAAENGCEEQPTDTEVTDEVIHRIYPCPEGTAVEFYVVLGGGHNWPGSEFYKGIEHITGKTTLDVSATEESWEFFQRWRLEDPPSP